MQAGTHRGDAVKAVLQEGDKAVSIPENMYFGLNSYDVLIGNGEYPYLYNLPELVMVSGDIRVYVTDLAASTVRDDIRDSVAYYLDHFTIGQELIYSQVEAAIFEDAETGVNIPGINEIRLLSLSGAGQTIRSNGERILVENDQRIRAGAINVTVTVM